MLLAQTIEPHWLVTRCQSVLHNMKRGFVRYVNRERRTRSMSSQLVCDLKLSAHINDRDCFGQFTRQESIPLASANQCYDQTSSPVHPPVNLSAYRSQPNTDHHVTSRESRPRGTHEISPLHNRGGEGPSKRMNGTTRHANYISRKFLNLHETT